jgi:cytochrome c biogenesis protein CcmG, thiol:disulfide interchange protein DsbE
MTMPPPPPSSIPPPPPAHQPDGERSVAKKKGGIPKIAFVVGGVVIAAVAITALTQGGGTKTAATTTTVAAIQGQAGTTNAVPPKAGETQPITVTGAKLADLPEKGDDPSVGMLAPTMAGRDFQGSPVTVTPGDGRPKLLVFVAHWCPHCQREVPLLTTWFNDGSIPKSVDLVAISTSYQPSRGNPPTAWMAKVGWPTTLIADDEKSTAAQAYGLTGFPYFVLVDAKGNVVARDSGELELATVKTLLAKLAV